MATIMPMHEFFCGERESVDYNNVHYKQLHPTMIDLMVREAAPLCIYGERGTAVGYNDVHYEQLHPTTFDMMLREPAPGCIYGDRESVGYNDFCYEQWHPTTFDMMLREPAPGCIFGDRESVAYDDFCYEQWHPTTFDIMLREAAPVHGYRERAETFGLGASSSCNDGAILTRISSRVQQGNRDRRSFVDMTDSQRYTRTVCPGYKGSPAITHYVSVNPTMATRMESGVAWPNYVN